MNKTAYSEVYSFINTLSATEYYKIPNDVIDYINWHRDYKYNFKYDSTKTLHEQNLSKEAIAFILKLYYNYFADNEKKNNINSIIYKKEELLNERLKQKYNPDDLFKNQQINEIKEKNIQENVQKTALVEYKDNFFTKFKNFILKLLHIK